MSGLSNRWRPSPYLVFSAVVTLVCVVGALVHPDDWRAYFAAALATQIVLIGSGFVPRSRLLGANISRLPQSDADGNEIALTFDDGPDPDVTPAVLEILAQRNVRATFFCIGRKAAEHPRLIAAIAEAGHSIGNHSWSHSKAFWFLGLRGLERELTSTQDTLSRLARQTPVYFRAPAGIRSPLLDAVLARLDLRLVSWTRRGFDTVDREPNRVLLRLTKDLAPGEILLLHDGSVARESDGTPVVLDVLPRLLDVVEEMGLVAGPLEPGR